MANEVKICWPAWMPVPLQNDYGYQPTDRRTRTDMEVGSIVRVNFDTDETQFNCSLLLDQSQAAWFEAFERDVLNQGSRWFEMPLQSSGCITWHTARFKTRPKASLPGPWHTTYTFTLEVEKRPQQLCPEVLQFMFCVSPQDIIGAAANAGTFWMSLQQFQAPTWIYNIICSWLDGFLWCVPPDELCGTALAVREVAQEVLPTINIPDIDN